MCCRHGDILGSAYHMLSSATFVRSLLQNRLELSRLECSHKFLQPSAFLTHYSVHGVKKWNESCHVIKPDSGISYVKCNKDLTNRYSQSAIIQHFGGLSVLKMLEISKELQWKHFEIDLTRSTWRARIMTNGVNTSWESACERSLLRL